MGGGKFGHPEFREAHPPDSTAKARSLQKCASALACCISRRILSLQLFNFLVHQAAPCTSVVEAKLTVFSGLTVRNFCAPQGHLPLFFLRVSFHTLLNDTGGLEFYLNWPAATQEF